MQRKHTLFFDGLNASVKAVKEKIIKKLDTKSKVEDLILTNHQRAEYYTYDSELIQTNNVCLCKKVKLKGTLIKF